MHPNTFLDQIWRGEETDEVFVAMSFHSRFDDRFNTVFKAAIESIRVNDIRLRANRVDESKSGDSIITDIIKGISQARIVLADISATVTRAETGDVHRNGNVMYELGLAHAVKSPAQVVIVRDDREKLLFDISSIPHATVDFTDETGAKKVVANLVADRLREDERIIDIKLRNFLSTMTPGELHLLERLATCPPGKIMQLDTEIAGIRITPIPTNTALIGLRGTAAVQAHHIAESPTPLYSLSSRGRRLCALLGIKLAPADTGAA